MLMAKKTAFGVDFTYTDDDTFEFTITTDSVYEAGSTVDLQIACVGNEAKPIITKSFPAAEQPILISLSALEAEKLKLGEVYSYRLTFMDVLSKRITKVSGKIKVKWGA